MPFPSFSEALNTNLMELCPRLPCSTNTWVFKLSNLIPLSLSVAPLGATRQHSVPHISCLFPISVQSFAHAGPVPGVTPVFQGSLPPITCTQTPPSSLEPASGNSQKQDQSTLVPPMALLWTPLHFTSPCLASSGGMSPFAG